jgi:hypothetical protein
MNLLNIIIVNNTMKINVSPLLTFLMLEFFIEFDI